MRFLLLVPVLAALSTSCKSHRPTETSAGPRLGSDSDAVFFSLEHTPCFGKCPAYTVTIDADGHAKWKGRINVERSGDWISTLDRPTMTFLLKRAKALGFFSMQAKYDADVTDLPSTIVRVNADGQDKRIVARYRIPPELKAFIASADSLAQQVKWTPVNDQR